MGSDNQKYARRIPIAVAGFVAVCLLAMGCAPAAGGPAGPTTTTSTTLPWSPPTGQWTYFDMTCYFSVLGSYYDFQQNASVNAKAPTTVNTGDTFDITLTPGTFDVPTILQGYWVQNVHWFTIRFPMPDNVEFVDSVMSAGLNMGPGYPSLSIEGNMMVYRVPGPFVPGSTVQMPKDRLTFKATGAPGTIIQTRMDSLSNGAQFDLTAVYSTCIPNNQNLIFSTTVITAP